MKRYEIQISQLTTTFGGEGYSNRYETRYFDDEQKAKAYMWAVMPEGKPDHKSETGSKGDGYYSRTYVFGSFMKDSRTEISFTDRGPEFK